MKIRRRLLVLGASFALAVISGCDDSPGQTPGVDVSAEVGFGDSVQGDVVGDDATDSDGLGPDTEDTGAQPEVTPSEPPSLTNPTTGKPFEAFGEIAIQPAIALAQDGSAVVAFTGRAGSEGDLQIFAGVLDASGQALAPAVAISEATGLQNEPAACRLRDGNVVVAWSVDTQTTGPDGENLQVRFRLVDPSGTPIGATSTRVLTERPGNHWLAEIACDPNGGFAVTGVRPDDTTPAFSVFTQRFDPSGTPLRQPQDLLDGSDGGQVVPAVSVTSSGDAITVWEDTSNINTPQEQTVIGLRSEAPDGTLGPFVVAFTGTTLQRPVVAANDFTGTALVGAAVDQKVALGVLASPQASVLMPLAFDPDPGVPVYNVQLAATHTDDSWFVLYYKGVGGTVTVKLARIDSAGTLLEGPIDLASGNIPGAYAPTMSYRDGRLVAAWTVGLGDGKFGLRSVTFTAP